MAWFLNTSTWPVDGTLANTAAQGQSRPVKNYNEGVLNTPHKCTICVSLSDYDLIFEEVFSCLAIQSSTPFTYK